jgi:hypothetical protein
MGMADEATNGHSSGTASEPSQHRSATENIRELTEASKQLLQAGKQMSENLSELSERVEHAKNVGSQILKSPWLLAGGAVAAGALVLLMSRRD